MGKRILLADDSVTIQKVVELTFMDEDYEVTAVGNGDAAVARLREERPDLVITDVHMPGANGYEVCRQAKELHPGLPVLLLVGTFEAFQENEASSCGADGHLKKPFDSQELLRRVDELLAAGPAADATPAEAGDLTGAGFELEPEAESAGEEASAAYEAEPPGGGGWEPTWGEPAQDSGFEAAEGSETTAMPAGEMEIERSPWEEEGGHQPVEVARAEGLMNVETLGAAAPLEDIRALEDRPADTEGERESAVGAPAASFDGGEAGGARGELSAADVDRIARRVVELMGDRLLREVAWEVVPDLAEVVIKDRIRELERQLE